MELNHLSLAVSDWRASRDWYLENPGFRLEFDLPQGGAEGLGVAAIQDDAGLTIFLEQVSVPIRSGQAAYTIQVDDVAGLSRKLQERGVTLLHGPGRQYWGYGAAIADPDGHVLRLYDEASMRARM